MVSKRGSGRNMPLSMKDIMSDSSMLGQKLGLLSQGDFKTNLKFLKYKFNPNETDGDESKLSEGGSEQYGQFRQAGKEKVSINVFYEHKNVLFQDERAPLVYRKLFIEK